MLAEARAVEASADTPEELIGAQGTEAYAKFMSLDPADKLEAVRILEELYVSNQNSPVVRARAINMLTQMMVTSNSKAIFNAVFKSDSFNRYLHEGDALASISDLSKASYALQPTELGVAYALMEHWGKLTNYDKLYKLTDAEKKEHARLIAEAMPLLDAAHASDVQEVGESERASLTNLMYYYWAGYMYGAAARGDAQYEDEAKLYFEKLFEYYPTQVGADGKPFAALELRMPGYHFAYAMFLIRMGGDENIANGKTHLQSAMDIVNANPSYHEHGFVEKIRRVANASFDGLDESSVKSRSFQKAADVYPPFRDFARTYGLILK